MKDIAIHLQGKPGALAEMGETLGDAGVSLEGGAVFVHRGNGIAHFLVEDAEKARQALEAKHIHVAAISNVLIQKLKQDVPGQLGKICRLMAKNNINILVQYSDHYNQLILVVDDYEKGKRIADNWSKGIYE
ncbi:MAG TPA: ACT domain-containing protein [Chitinophagaceae bacterium]|nr:ACT domain-containing protein [Chitinophagaceae bacterium]